MWWALAYVSFLPALIVNDFLTKSLEFGVKARATWIPITITYLKPSTMGSILGYVLLVAHIGLILSLYSNPDEFLTIYPHPSTAAYLSGLGLLLINVMVSLYLIGAGKSYKLGSHTSWREQVTSKKLRLKGPIWVIRNSARLVKHRTVAYFKDVGSDLRFMFINYSYEDSIYVFVLFIAPFLHNPEPAAKSLLYPLFGILVLVVLAIVAQMVLTRIITNLGWNF